MTTSLIDDSKPTHLSPQTAAVRMQFTTAKGEINDLYLRSPSLVDGREYGFIEGDTGETEANPARWQQMLTDAPDYSRVVLPRGRHLITAGAGGTGITGSNLIRKPLFLDFSGSRILWQPSTPNDWLLTVSGVGLSFSDGSNEEHQIFGFHLCNVRVLGNRVNRANAFRFMRVDYVTIDSLHVYCVKGTSLKLQRSRECEIKGIRTRYNGYVDRVNFENSAPDVNLCSDSDGGTVTGDVTNFCHFADSSLVFALGPLLQINSVNTMSFDQSMLHGLQLGNSGLSYGGGAGSSQEDAFFLAMQKVGVTVSGGFTGGVANNEYAGLHLPSTGNETSATNLPWIPAMRKCRPISATGNSLALSFNRLTVNGLFGDSCIHLSSSSLSLSSSVIGGANAATTHHTSQTFTVDATTNLMTMGAATPYLMTMDAVRLTTTGTLPAVTPTSTALALHPYGTDRVNNNTYYVRCTNAPTNTTYTLHRTWDDSRINASIIDFTDIGTGVHTLLHQHGDVVQLDNGSTLIVDNKTALDNSHWLVNDDITSKVIGNYISGTTINAVDIARQFGGLVCLAALKGANMQLTTDQSFMSIYIGSGLGFITHIIANTVSGSAAGAVGGLYGGVNKTGAIFIPATYSWSKLSGNGQILQWSGRDRIAAAIGTATQITSRSTLVTCQGLRGVITTDSTSLAAGGDAVFTVTNASVDAGDNVVVNRASGSTANTSTFTAINVANGSFQVWQHNLSAATPDTAAAVLNFHVDKFGPPSSIYHQFTIMPSLSLSVGSTAACFVDFYAFGIPTHHP